jgi:hypothetical protein
MQIVATIQHLISDLPSFGRERLVGGYVSYRTIVPECIEEIKTYLNTFPTNKKRNQLLRKKINQLVSIECAAGVEWIRCKKWYSVLADLARISYQEEPHVSQDVEEIVAFKLIAGEYDFSGISLYSTEQINSVDLKYLCQWVKGDFTSHNTPSKLFDDQYWHQLNTSLNNEDATLASSCFMGIADWWLSEYQQNEIPIVDLENYPCFELLPNAAFVFCTQVRKIPVHFSNSQYEQFYLMNSILLNESVTLN